jgi:hypothetical protein
MIFISGCAQVGGHTKHKQANSKNCKKNVDIPTLRCASTTTASFDKQGTLWVAWFDSGHVYVNRSTDKGQTFNPPVTVNRIPENVYAKGENRPKIAFGVKGEIYLSWTQKLKQKRFSGHIRFSRSIDGGKYFSDPITVNDHGENTSHRFDALAVNKNGDIYIAWLDKRDLLAAKKAGKKYNGSALYYALSTDGGKTFQQNKKIADNSCQCCRVAIAIDKQQLPVIIWRHIYGDNIRDHGIVTFSKPNQSNQAKRLSHDNWQIKGCPHHGPAISIADDGAYHITWFNNAPDSHGLFYVSSVNKAANFSTPLNFGNYEKSAGHADVLSLGKHVYIVWKEFDGKESTLNLKQSSNAGKSWSPPTQLAKTNTASDHPFLVKNGKEVYVSWHRMGEEYRLLQISH